MLKQGIILVLFQVCLAVSLVGCASGGELSATPTPLPQLVNTEKIIFEVERGPIISQREVAGEVVPARQDELYFRTSGFVSRVLVRAGDLVKQGDVLAELQMDDLLDQLQQARIDLEVAQNQLATEELQRAYDVQQAESEVVIWQKQVDLAKINLEGASEAQKDEAQINLDIAQERLKIAQAWLDLVKGEAGSESEQIVLRNQLALDRLERQVEERQLIAPYDGIVLRMSLTPGQKGEAFQDYAVIGDPTQLVIQVPYDYELTTNVDANTLAYLLLDESQNPKYESRFVPDFLPISNKKEGISIEGDEVIVNFLYFSAPDELSEGQIPVGSRVDLLVVLGSKEDALLLPPAAIRGNDAFKYLIVLEDEYHRRVEVVEIGVKTKDRWEIIANVEEGDRVLGP